MRSRERLGRLGGAAVLLGAVAVVSAGSGTPAGAGVSPTVTTAAVPTPPGSGNFGWDVLVLSNGNVVVADPGFDGVGGADIGAVRLYDGTSGALISTLTGASPDDRIGSGTNRGPNEPVADGAGVGSLFEVGDGDLVVVSPFFDLPGVPDVGAVTHIDGVTGRSGVVSAANSLVGSQPFDEVGSSGIVVLGDGDYVVTSVEWGGAGDLARWRGAVTFADGASGLVGTVSAANSLVGFVDGSSVGSGGVVELVGGDFVVVSPEVSDFRDAQGAATWGDGEAGIVGDIGVGNSFMGYREDRLGSGGVVPLTNGDYVIVTPTARAGDPDSPVVGVGTVFLADGSQPSGGIVGLQDDAILGSQLVGEGLHGRTAGDAVGSGGAVALAGGDFVVLSPQWQDDAVVPVGAVTWRSASDDTSDEVNSANSTHGSVSNDFFLVDVVSLPGGGYVLAAPRWDRPGVGGTDHGAVARFTGAVPGPLTAAASLHGSTSGDRVGSGGVTVLADGDAAVASPGWDAPGAADVGAVTWVPGGAGLTGPVSTANSLHGSTVGDNVGSGSVVALREGAYAVISPSWDAGPTADVGAVTWRSGLGATPGPVTTVNSRFGASPGDRIGDCSCDRGPAGNLLVTDTGDLVVASALWDLGTTVDVGVVTWIDGAAVTAGAVTAANSLHGSNTDDRVGVDARPGSHPDPARSLVDLGDGAVAVTSLEWDHGGVSDAGAVTLLAGSATAGPISSANSVLGAADGAGSVLLDVAGPTGADVVLVAARDNVLRELRIDRGPSFPTVPSDVDAASFARPVAVTYPLPVATDLRSVPSVSCSPASGSTFPVGPTVVTCVATDSAGLVAEVSFTVAVSVTAGGVRGGAEAGIPAARCSIEC